MGDLVRVKNVPARSAQLRHQVGLISDILEDDYGTAYFEVHFVTDRGWFQSHEIETVSAKLADA